MRQFYLPGLRDKPPCKSRPWFEGYVWRFDGGEKPRIVATVRGETLEEMRQRKHIIFKAIADASHAGKQGEE